MTPFAVKDPASARAGGAAWLVRFFWPVAATLLVIRLLLAARCNLVPDEAFYWTWTRHLSTGYFDHPPMIAWLMWISTRLLGNTELGVRFPAAVLSIASLAVLYGLALQLLHDARAVGFVVLMWIAGPLLPVIGTIITPDAPATFFSMCALACAALLADRDDRNDPAAGEGWTSGAGLWLLFGLCCGLAFLSKYTTVLLPAGVALAMLTSRRGLRHFRRPWIYLSGLMALAVFSPCILWNYHHHWASFRFQVQHGAGGGLPAYQFTKDRHHWSYHDVIDAGAPNQGELSLQITGPDPQLIGLEGLWNAADTMRLSVEAAFLKTAPRARLRWQTLELDEFTAAQSIEFEVIPDGQYRVYEINLASAPKYAGGITRLRLDPIASGAGDARIRIKSIAFQPIDAGEGLHGFIPRLLSVGGFIGGQAVVWTPILFGVAVVVLAMNWGNYGNLCGVDRLLLWSAALPLVFFGFMSTRSHGEINWPAFAYFPLSILVARYLAGNWKGNRVQWVRIGCMVAFGFTVGLHLIAAAPVQQWIIARHVHLTHQVTDLWDGPRFAKEVDERAGGLAVICNRHQDAGEAAFYLPGQPDVWCDSVGSRITAFDFFDQGRPDYDRMNRVLFVGSHVEAFMKRRNYTERLETGNVVVSEPGKNRSHVMTKLGR